MKKLTYFTAGFWLLAVFGSFAFGASSHVSGKSTEQAEVPEASKTPMTLVEQYYIRDFESQSSWNGRDRRTAVPHTKLIAVHYLSSLSDIYGNLAVVRLTEEGLGYSAGETIAISFDRLLVSQEMREKNSEKLQLVQQLYIVETKQLDEIHGENLSDAILQLVPVKWVNPVMDPSGLALGLVTLQSPWNDYPPGSNVEVVAEHLVTVPEWRDPSATPSKSFSPAKPKKDRPKNLSRRQDLELTRSDRHSTGSETDDSYSPSSVQSGT